ncbi:hypothetical protein COCMIDRAFT_23904 [Bipolaris oryzae ATCC 44560]|uniref:Uncharacterized protein n=1 Tax=Bipolaris oryzae ATCC 44560 TaxID=930090 RepID=W6Z9F9_COCMI|nr:uncharacterized protein COCMIDRAFT_23904 [Bipolaris oryzae ATCC 44560]EUC48362.1 hypothetical protein COCMIDRAFT_23904 [Bipolaris oryzae ATCC 44560]
MPNLPLAIALHATDICHLQKGPIDLRWMDGWVDGVGCGHGRGCEPVAGLPGPQGGGVVISISGVVAGFPVEFGQAVGDVYYALMQGQTPEPCSGYGSSSSSSSDGGGSGSGSSNGSSSSSSSSSSIISNTTTATTTIPSNHPPHHRHRHPHQYHQNIAGDNALSCQCRLSHVATRRAWAVARRKRLFGLPNARSRSSSASSVLPRHTHTSPAPRMLVRLRRTTVDAFQPPAWLSAAAAAVCRLSCLVLRDMYHSVFQSSGTWLPLRHSHCLLFQHAVMTASIRARADGALPTRTTCYYYYDDDDDDWRRGSRRVEDIDAS